MLGGSGDVELYAEDNIAVDRLGRPLEQLGRYTTSPASFVRVRKPRLPSVLTILPSKEVQDAVIRNAGARPWNRDEIDQRIVADVIEGRGGVIDSEQDVGGYPVHSETRQPFDPAAWDLDTMTPRSGMQGT